MGDPKKGWALVTGASGGIGLQIARELASRKFNLVLVARSGDKLKQAAVELAGRYGVQALAMAEDLGRPGAGGEVHGELTARGLEVEVLVNNAGFGTAGPFTETDLASELEMIQLNISALTELAKLFVKDMAARGRGRVLNVASTAAFQPGPFMAVYYATKAYVLSFSEALAYELKGTGVTVTALCPGPTRTGFDARADMGDSPLFKSPLVQDAATVARRGVEGMLKGKPLVFTSFANWLLAFSVRFSPRALATAIAGNLSRKR
jgi:uncharacterized protein